MVHVEVYFLSDKGWLASLQNQKKSIKRGKSKKSHTSRLSSQCRNFHNVKALNISFLSFCNRKIMAIPLPSAKNHFLKRYTAVRRSVSSKLLLVFHFTCRVAREFDVASEGWGIRAWGPFLESPETFRTHISGDIIIFLSSKRYLQGEGVSRHETLQLF